MLNEVTSDILKYMLGGNARFTIYQEALSGKKSANAEYSIVKVSQEDYLGSVAWYVYTKDLKGESSYHGFIKYDRGGELKFIKSKKVQYYNENNIKALMWVVFHARNLNKHVHVLNNGKCSVCKSELQTENELKKGMCYSCYSK